MLLLDLLIVLVTLSSVAVSKFYRDLCPLLLSNVLQSVWIRLRHLGHRSLSSLRATIPVFRRLEDCLLGLSSTVLRYAKFGRAVVEVTHSKIGYWLTFFDPARKALLVAKLSRVTQMDKTDLRPDQWQDSLVTFSSWWAHCKSLLLDTRKSVHVGGPAYSACVYTLDACAKRILDYQCSDRPLVLIFGSRT